MNELKDNDGNIDWSKKRLCWIDRLVIYRGSLTAALTYLALVVVWYLLSTSPLWITGQLAAAADWIFLIGAVGLLSSLLLYRAFRLGLNDRLVELRLLIMPAAQTDFDRAFEKVFARAGRVRSVWLVTAFAVLGFAVSLHTEMNGLTHLGLFAFLSPHWHSSEGMMVRHVALVVATFPIFVLIATSVRLMYFMIFAGFHVLDLEMIPSPQVISNKTIPSLRFALFASLLFSSFAGLFILLFGSHVLHPVYFGFVAAVIAVGVAGVIFPIYVGQRKIREIKEARAEAISIQIIKLANSENKKDSGLLLDLYKLEEQMELNERLGRLFVGWRYMVSFVASVILPVSIGIISNLLYARFVQ